MSEVSAAARAVVLAGARIAMLGALGCARPAPTAGPVLVRAASSLTEALPAALSVCRQGEPAPELAFDASSRLARQIEAGAPSDLVVTADEEWMDWLAARDRIEPASRAVLAQNRLVLVVPATAARAPATPEALASDGEIARLAVAEDAVPAGRYARAALSSAGEWARLEPRLVRGDSVRTVLAWVARGDAQAGIVYATDARAEPRVRVGFAFPPSSHAPIRYPLAVVRGAPHLDEAHRLAACLRTPAARAVLERAGFLPPDRSDGGVAP